MQQHGSSFVEDVESCTGKQIELKFSDDFRPDLISTDVKNYSTKTERGDAILTA